MSGNQFACCSGVLGKIVLLAFVKYLLSKFGPQLDKQTYFSLIFRKHLLISLCLFRKATEHKREKMAETEIKTASGAAPVQTDESRMKVLMSDIKFAFLCVFLFVRHTHHAQQSNPFFFLLNTFILKCLCVVVVCTGRPCMEG